MAVMSNLVGRRGRIYLTGFMGSGKSTVGPILANTLGYDFVDLDRTIEQAEEMSIGELFRLRGEDFFRRRERELIGQLSRDRRLVIALGGGAVVDPANREIIRTTGILVYLRVPKELLMKRLQYREDRPLLTDAGGSRLSEGDLRQRVEALLRTREPFYAKADLIVDVDERHIGMTVDRVARSLTSLLR
jgi:shikimate kinase